VTQKRIPAVYMRGGTSKVAIGAQVRREGDRWIVTRVVVSRNARRLMEGWVLLPGE